MRSAAIQMKPEHNVKLAAMECFTSCALTYINSQGRDYSRILLDYWSLNYQFRTLLSSKEASLIPMDIYYGIDMKFTRGNKELLMDWIGQGHSAIYLCIASKLPYFPRELLSMESSGFQHCILVYGWNEEARCYSIADPMVDYIGEIGEEELQNAGGSFDRRNELHYFTLAESEAPFVEPEPKQLFAYSSRRNNRFFHGQREQLTPVVQFDGKEEDKEASKRRTWLEMFSNRHGGSKALELFALDVEASRNRQPDSLNAWISRNNLTLTSIIRIRGMVWESFCRLGVMTDTEKSEGEARLAALLQLWRSLNFLLAKYRNQGTRDTVCNAIKLKISAIAAEESAFLQWMCELRTEELG